MSSSHEPLRLSADDLYSPRVDAFLDEQAMMNRALARGAAAAVDPGPGVLLELLLPEPRQRPGGFLAWMIMEPFFDR